MKADRLIVGFGNPLRSDDGFGWHLAQRVERSVGPGIEAIAVHQLTPELVDELAGRHRVAFVDAAIDLRPGGSASATVEPVEPVLRTPHALRPASLLGLYEWLHGPAPESRLFAVGVRSVEHGEALTAELEASLPSVLEGVIAWLSGSEGAAVGPGVVPDPASVDSTDSKGSRPRATRPVRRH